MGNPRRKEALAIGGVLAVAAVVYVGVRQDPIDTDFQQRLDRETEVGPATGESQPMPMPEASARAATAGHTSPARTMAAQQLDRAIEQQRVLGGSPLDRFAAEPFPTNQHEDEVARANQTELLRTLAGISDIEVKTVDCKRDTCQAIVAGKTDNLVRPGVIPVARKADGSTVVHYDPELVD